MYVLHIATRFMLVSCLLARVAIPKPYSEYTKQLIVLHHRQDFKPGDTVYHKYCWRKESRQAYEESPSS